MRARLQILSGSLGAQKIRITLLQIAVTPHRLKHEAMGRDIKKKNIYIYNYISLARKNLGCGMDVVALYSAENSLTRTQSERDGEEEPWDV